MTALNYRPSFLKLDEICNNLHWEYFLFVALVWLDLIVTEHEDVAACRMTVEVTEEENVTGFECAFHHQLRVVVYRVEFARGADPLSVEILAHKRASVVANDDAIRVEHRNKLKDKGIP